MKKFVALVAMTGMLGFGAFTLAADKGANNSQSCIDMCNAQYWSCINQGNSDPYCRFNVMYPCMRSCF